MIRVPLSVLSRWLQEAGTPPLRAKGGSGQDRVPGDPLVTGVEIDSRRIVPGNLFLALRGERTHGAAFLGEAPSRGAAAALVEAVPGDGLLGGEGTTAAIPVLRIPDARAALATLAARWRARFDLPLIAVTGSNGKTTVKEMIGGVLRSRGPALATSGNLNNELGVPLTLLGLAPEHQAGVLELGANHPGEIRALGRLVRPRVGVVTQCAPAHLEGFGSLAGVARAKGELFEALPPDGIGVVNADDPAAPGWLATLGGRRVITFGLERPAELRPRDPEPLEEGGTRFQLRLGKERTEVTLPLPGRHNVANALAAAAACVALELTLEEIGAALGEMSPVGGRLVVRAAPSGGWVIDDSYNANPRSLAAALEVLAARPGRAWLVLGAMAELGPGARAMHAQAGRLARSSGVERLLTLGEGAEAAARSFGAGGEHCRSLEALLERLRGEPAPGTTLLVKGSRAMAMERVVRALLSPPLPGGARAGGGHHAA